MKLSFFIFIFALRLYASSMTCKFAMFPPNQFKPFYMDDFKSIIIEEGISSISTDSYTVNHVFFKGVNKGDFQTINTKTYYEELFKNKLSPTFTLLKIDPVAKIKMTLQRDGIDDIYARFDYDDKSGKDQSGISSRPIGDSPIGIELRTGLVNNFSFAAWCNKQKSETINDSSLQLKEIDSSKSLEIFKVIKQ
jgi:hypothetical protein